MIKVVQNFSSFFGSIWLTRPLIIHNMVHWSVRHTQSFRCPLIYPIKWDNWLLHCLFLTKKANNFFTNFLPILQKMQNITIIYERNACQFRLKYTWLRELFYRKDTWRTDGSSIKYIYPHPKNDNKIGPKCKISSECSLSQNNKKHYNNIFS